MNKDINRQLLDFIAASPTAIKFRQDFFGA